MDASRAIVRALWRWPVKGLGGEDLPTVHLTEGALFPYDRAFALENGPSDFDPDAPEHVSKRQFICMVKQPQSGRLTARFDDTEGVLHIQSLDGKTLTARADDAADLEAIAAELIHLGVRGSMRLRSANDLSGGHGFTDVPDRWVSLQNQATIDAVADELGAGLDPRRLRANVLVEGWPAWQEEEMVGKTIVLGDAKLEVAAVINRCGAIDVNPASSERDTDLLRVLKQLRGRLSMGLYAKVTRGGEVRPGADVSLEP